MNKKPFVAEDLFAFQLIGNPGLTPDGQRLAAVITRMNEKANGYESSVVVGEPGDLKVKWGEKSIRQSAPAWSPDGQTLAYLSNESGKAQLYVKGREEALASFPLGVNSYTWAPDNQGFYVVAKEERPKPVFRDGATVRRITKLRYKANGTGFLDGNPRQIWYLALDAKDPEQLTFGEYDCNQVAVSPCGRYLAFVSNREADELKTLNDIWLLDLESRQLRNLTGGKGQSGNPAWLDGEHLLYMGHQKGYYPGGYPELRKINILNDENTNLLPDFPHYIGNSIGGDVRADSGNSSYLLNEDKTKVYFVATEGGNSYLQCLNLADGQVTHVYGSGQMVITSFDIKSGYAVLNIASPTTPGDLWWGPLAGEIEQVSFTNADLLAEKYIGWPEVIHFNHPDGTALEGWLIKPAGFTEGETYPLVMEIHGGPHTTYGNVFFHEWQMLAGAGLGVFYTNPRGSIGYGEEFSRAVVGDWCGVDADDLQFVAEKAAKLPWVDVKRLGVTGGSQGGYFTNWLIGHTDMFSAAVTQRSMSNLYTKYGMADNGWNGDRYGMGGRDLWDSEDFIMERSPMRYAPQVKTPTLIIHSDEDYRCPLEQGEQWYVALKRLGVTAELLLFHGENHELSRGGKPANRIVRLEAILDWFVRFLKQ